ncbi:MAG: HAMP domain-containing protein [Anaerolineaceae bacterium]|nr:HAMP domain-containing protein [Anaerolineaceae bacterium]MCB9099073.1 HAMP domain-containing protein [Anaerolineales bacterium]
MLEQVLGWRLRDRLLVSYLMVIVITIVVIGIIVGWLGLPRIENVLVLSSRRQAFQLAPLLADYYNRSGSWDEVIPLIHAANQPLPPDLMIDVNPIAYPRQLKLTVEMLSTPNQLIVTDSHYRVVADSRQELDEGQPLPADLYPLAAPIDGHGQIIGQLIMVPNFGNDITPLATVALRRTLLGAGLLAGVLGLVTSFFLAKNLTAPILALNRAARQLAAGQSPVLPAVRNQDEIGELTATFNHMVEALATQQRLRQQLVADIAHELRTPLSIMQLELEGLEDGLQEPALAAHALYGELKKLEQLIEDLRLISLVDAGGLQLEKETVDLGWFLPTVVQSWRKQLDQQQIAVTIDLAPDLPPLQADVRRLTQVLNNLISNAIRYTPEDGRLTIKAQAQPQTVLITLTDTGLGISAEDLPHIFDRFYRADHSRNRKTGGSGLGLAIAKQLVTLHGGRIWAESQPSQGTTFFLTLPITD